MLTDRNQIDRDSLFVPKVWTGDQNRVTRAEPFTAGSHPVGTSATLAAQKFHDTGLDARFLRHSGHGSAFTLGDTADTSDSPYTELNSINPLIAPYGSSGTLFIQR